VQKESWVLPGHLYMVATPIGNLADLTPRAQAVLADVDVVAAEDTRHTGQLLSALGLRKTMVSIHDHNEAQRAASVIEQLLSGKSVAYVSDAGTPAISDPGALLAAAAAQAGVVVTPIPGASSVLAAISASGLDVRNGFVFAGFLPTGNKDRQSALDVMAQAERVTVFFEAPHRIMATLSVLSERFPTRQLVLAKELSKVYERFIRGSSLAVLQAMQANTDWQRGEFVLLLDKTSVVEEDAQALRMEQVLLPLLAELPLSQAVKLTCAITGQKKKPIYDLALSLQGDKSTSAC